MIAIELSEITAIFPRALELDEIARAEALILAALDLIEEAFLRQGRAFYLEAETSRLLNLTAKRVVREMISEAIHIGDNVGRASASSTTGPQSDSVTWSQGVGIHWGGVHLNDRWLRELGLLANSASDFHFPHAKRYADPAGYLGYYGAEFSERGR